MIDEARPADVSRIQIGFHSVDSDGGFPIALLTISDPGCDGAYSIHFEHRVQDRRIETDYLPDKLRWGEPMHLQAQWWPDGRVILSVDHGGRIERRLGSKIDSLFIRATSGGLRTAELDFDNLAGQ